MSKLPNSVHTIPIGEGEISNISLESKEAHTDIRAPVIMQVPRYSGELGDVDNWEELEVNIRLISLYIRVFRIVLGRRTNATSVSREFVNIVFQACEFICESSKEGKFPNLPKIT